jgi:uncharacterized membrane protein YdjX (TVP38/TMEM64 family)
MNDVSPAPARRAGALPLIRRFLPLLVLLVAIALVFVLGLDQYLSFETLRRHRAELLAFVERNAVLAPVLFVLVYAAVIALSIPGGAILTIAGGFLFGIVLGTILVVIGATAGATAIFLIARSALGDALRARIGPRARRMEEGFREDAFNYLLFLRLIPLFPFWLVNIVPALLGVGLGTYVVATAIGIIPGSLVYASVGNGLGAVFDAGETPDLGIIFRLEIILPIAGIALLALLPVGYRKFKARRAK